VTERHVSIVGLGLIGASLGAALRHAGWKVRGCDPAPDVRRTALEHGHVDAVYDDRTEALDGAEFVILAAPVSEIIELVPLAVREAPTAVIIDAGSVKTPIVQAMEQSAGADRCVGGHPIAGKEVSGPAAADRELFFGRPFVLTPHSKTSQETLRGASEIVEAVGGHLIVTSAEEHDRTVARTSHLPQLVSYALASILEEGDENYAGTGLTSMTRLALSPPPLWKDILNANRTNLREEVARLQQTLNQFIGSLDLEGEMNSARAAAQNLRVAATS
jgi:prephenate dehydrogenase